MAGADIVKIAMVDDSLLIVGKIMEVVNEEEGVEFVGNAAAIPSALDLLRATRPDILILDISLGDAERKTGVDLLVMIRNVYPSMKILMLTNRVGDRYRRQCFDNGADYFFDKSNDFESVAEVLRQIVELKRRC